MELLTTGETVQIFMDKKSNLILTVPEFFLEWKKEQGIINE